MLRKSITSEQFSSRSESSERYPVDLLFFQHERKKKTPDHSQIATVIIIVSLNFISFDWLFLADKFQTATTVFSFLLWPDFVVFFSIAVYDLSRVKKFIKSKIVFSFFLCRRDTYLFCVNLQVVDNIWKRNVPCQPSQGDVDNSSITVVQCYLF